MHSQKNIKLLTQLISKLTTGHNYKPPPSQLLSLSYHFFILYFQAFKGTMSYPDILNSFIAIQ